MNVYSPNTEPSKVQFFSVLSKCEPEEFLLLGEDFNYTENDHIEPHAASKRVMKQLVEAHRLTDIRMEMHQKLSFLTIPWCLVLFLMQI